MFARRNESATNFSATKFVPRYIRTQGRLSGQRAIAAACGISGSQKLTRTQLNIPVISGPMPANRGWRASPRPRHSCHSVEKLLWARSEPGSLRRYDSVSETAVREQLLELTPTIRLCGASDPESLQPSSTGNSCPGNATAIRIRCSGASGHQPAQLALLHAHVVRGGYPSVHRCSLVTPAG